MKRVSLFLNMGLLLVVGVLIYRNYKLKELVESDRTVAKSLAKELVFRISKEDTMIKYAFFRSMSVCGYRTTPLYNLDSILQRHTDSLAINIVSGKGKNEKEKIMAREKQRYGQLLDSLFKWRPDFTESLWEVNLNETIKLNNDDSLLNLLLSTRLRLISHDIKSGLINLTTGDCDNDFYGRAAAVPEQPVIRLGETYTANICLVQSLVGSYIVKINGKPTRFTSKYSVKPTSTGLHEFNGAVERMAPGGGISTLPFHSRYYVLPAESESVSGR